MLGGSCSPSVASGFDDIGSEKYQPPEREGRLESSAPEDTLRNGGTAANAYVSTVVPIPPKVPKVKLVEEITPEMIPPKPVGAPVNAGIGTASSISPKVPQLKLVKGIIPHTATPKPVTTAEKAVRQKRKANNFVGESPVARLKLNIDDVSLGSPARSSKSSALGCFSKAVLMDNLRSLAKLDLDNESAGTLPTSSENTLHILSRANLLDNLRALAKNNNLSDVAINDCNQSPKEQQEGKTEEQ